MAMGSLQMALEAMVRQFDKPGLSEEQASAISLAHAALNQEAAKSDRGADVRRYKVYAVRPAKEKGADPVWVSAGTAWRNRDGTMSVYLDVLPLDGKLTFRE